MGDFKGVAEKFRLNLIYSDGGSERVVVQIGLEGLKLLSAVDNHALRSYELGHISRWQCRGNQLILYTKTSADLEERQLTLQGDEHTVRSALDTLTCSCMQLAELLQSKKTETATETANNLHALIAGGGKKKASPSLPSADEVDYWRSPDKAGWLQSQGEVMKQWRRRWFVLKQGYLFRFMNSSVSESTKPRGVVDLSKVQDVKAASAVTGRANSIQLKTSSGGSVTYICDSETEMVEWVSALEGAISKIVRHLAGVEEEEAPPPSSSANKSGSKSGTSGKGGADEWIRQLERNFESLSATGGTSTTSDRYGGERQRDSRTATSSSNRAMVDVVGYESYGYGGGGSSSSRSQGYSREQPPARDPNYSLPSYGGGSSGGGRDGYGGGGSSGINYGQIAGANVAGASSAIDDVALNYGGGLGGSSASGAGGSSAGYSLNRAPSGQMAYGGYSQQAPAATAAYPSYSQQQVPTTSSYSQPSYSQQPSYGQQQGYAPMPASSPLQHQQQAVPNGYSHATAGYSQPTAAPAVSLIDQVPQQQPTYPYFQQQAGAMAAATAAPVAATAMAPQQQQQQQQQLQHAPSAPAPGASWQVHYTAEGRPYYYNTATGTTQWEAPPGIVA